MTERQLDEDERRQEPERQVQRGSPPLEAALPRHAEHPARQGGHGQDLRDGERPPVIRAGGERSPDEHRLEAGDGAEVEPPFAREIGRRHRPSGRGGPGHRALGFADPAVGPSRMRTCYGATGVLEVAWGGGKLPIFTPIVDGGAGLGASPGSEVNTTGAGVDEPGRTGR